MEIRRFAETDRVAVIDLWRDGGLLRPWNDPDRDIDRKVERDPDGFVVGEFEGRVVATAMFGYDGHRGSVNYLSVAPAHRSGGLASQLMTHIEARLLELGCPKVGLQVRADNDGVVGFYEARGYVEDPVRSLGLRLIADD